MLRPQNFAIVPDSLAPNLEKVKYDKPFQSSDLFALLYFLLHYLQEYSKI